MADLEALDGEVDPIDQAAFVEGVLVGQFQFDVPDQEFQFGALLFVQRRLLLQLLAQGGQFAQQTLFGMVFPSTYKSSVDLRRAPKGPSMPNRLTCRAQMCAIRINPQQAFQQREEVRQFGVRMAGSLARSSRRRRVRPSWA